MNAKSYYTCINYKNTKTQNITNVRIDTSYMDEQMNKNFKQHVINEFINDYNIEMDKLSESLLKVATYFYYTSVGTWCVFITQKNDFIGSIHFINNRYLRMTAENKNKKYNIVLFETPV
ncbi:hypothetical protein HEP_00337200 [Hepatocystis sp. ex Piliocolobus tephrosceles]|nr:hypothetical protein HEP_00337200 [Hepatocystis sp. ex Piliocolobus tephrosceles]